MSYRVVSIDYTGKHNYKGTWKKISMLKDSTPIVTIKFKPYDAREIKKKVFKRLKVYINIEGKTLEKTIGGGVIRIIEASNYGPGKKEPLKEGMNLIKREHKELIDFLENFINRHSYLSQSRKC